MTQTQTQPSSRTRARAIRAAALGLLVLVVTVGAGAIAALLYTTHQPTLYASKVVVRVYDPTSLPASTSGRVDPARLVPLEVSYARSRQVSDRAQAALRRQAVVVDHVTWAGSGDQDAVSVTCFTGRPEGSVACAEQYATDYISIRQGEVSQSLLDTAKATESRAAALRKDVDAVQRRISAADPDKDSNAIEGLLVEQRSYLDQITTLAASATGSRSDAAGLAANYQIVQHAAVPHQKSSPTGRRNLELGLLAGLAVGVAVLLGWQQFSSRYRARSSPVVSPAAQHRDDSRDTRAGP